MTCGSLGYSDTGYITLIKMECPMFLRQSLEGVLVHMNKYDGNCGIGFLDILRKPSHHVPCAIHGRGNSFMVQDWN
jgi:hypothetical protein